jgi:hypothetical protein
MNLAERRLNVTVLAPPTLDTPFKRAVLPVVAGIVVLAAVFGVLWLGALWLTPRIDPSDNRFEPGRVATLMPRIAEEGRPRVFPAPAGQQNLAIWHTGTDPDRGWHAYSINSLDPECDQLIQFDPLGADLVDPCTNERYPFTGEGLTQFEWEVSPAGVLRINPRIGGGATTAPAVTSTTAP